MSAPPARPLAPWLIAILAGRWRLFPNDAKRANYQGSESAGIATGFLLLVVGHPAGDARVPPITKKSLDSISTFR